jgi:signal transduction histidine kinase/ActR/RegA family two-component response regulator
MSTLSSPVAPGTWTRIRACFHLSTWLGLALLGFIWIGTHLYLQLDEQKAIESAIGQNNNVALMFDEHVTTTIKDIDKNILFLRRARQNDPENFDLPAWTTHAYFLRDVTVQMALIGPDGFLISTNVDRNPKRMDLSDREHFRVHADGKADTLFVSKPVLGRATGKWTIQLTRRIDNADGSFGGVLVASLDPYHLSAFFERIDLGKDGAISLVGDDGLIRARGGLSPDLLGKSIAGTELFDALQRSTSGVVQVEGPLIGGRRIISFRHLKDFPLTVTVGRPEDEVLAGHQERSRLFLWTALGLSLVVAAVMLVGMNHELRLLQAAADRRESDRRIARKSEELEATLGRIGQGILMLDVDGRLRIVNHRAAELLGHAEGLTIGETLPDDVVRLLALGEDHSDPRDVRVGDREIELATAPMPDGGRLITLTDITAHRQNEAVLAEARDRAEAATRTRTAFLATMSHELRTPLNGVVGTMRLLEDCDDPEERSLYLGTMSQSAEHLLQIIDDILDITKLEADRITLDRAPFAVASTLRTAVELVGPRARDKGLAIDVEIAADVPPVLVGDAARLRQVLVNLVGNAVKFTERGCVILRADRVPPTAAVHPGALRIRVQDTGIGIAQEHLGSLFLKFSQLDGSITRRFGGTGLGLAISRELIEKMGGEITVTSTLGEGSTFTLVVPFEVGEVVGKPSGPTNAPASPGATTAADGLDILLAEDNPTNTLVATRLLTRMGHRVTAVADGEAALAALRQHGFDLVLMDVMMPRMDGLTAIRHIRAGRVPARKVPIVALTANALTEDRDEAFAAGADAFATKPVSLEKLEAAIVDAMTGAGSGSADAITALYDHRIRASA